MGFGWHQGATIVKGSGFRVDRNGRRIANVAALFILVTPETQTVPRVTATTTSYRWWVVFMLWFVCFFNYADRQAIFAVFPKLREEFGFDPVQLGLIGSAFMWVYAFGAPFAGFIGDRVRRKHLILGGCMFWSLVTVMTGWSSKLWHFVTVRALEGFGETFYFPASMSLLSDYHDKRTRSRALSFHQSSVYIGTIAGSWAGAWFAEHHGWRVGFYVFGGLGIFLALVLYRFLIEPPRAVDARPAENDKVSTTEVKPPGWREVLPMVAGRPTALLLMAAFVLANFVATIFLTWTPTFLVDKFGFKLTAAGLSGTVFIHLASAASVPLGGLLADRLSQRFAGGRMMVQAFGLLAGSLFVFLVGSTLSVTVLIASMVVFGLCKGLYDSNIFASLFDVVDPRARASAAGFMNLVGWTGGALGPLAIGWFTKHGRHTDEMANMSEAIAFGGAVYLVGAVLLLFAAWTAGKHSKAPKL
jgi:MFS family permease